MHQEMFCQLLVPIDGFPDSLLHASASVLRRGTQRVSKGAEFGFSGSEILFGFTQTSSLDSQLRHGLLMTAPQRFECRLGFGEFLCLGAGGDQIFSEYARLRAGGDEVCFSAFGSRS